MTADMDQFLRLVDAYAAATKLPDKTVSWRVFNDSGRVNLLRAGGDLGMRKGKAAVQWFSDNWPAGAEWPADVPRPAPSAPNEPAEAGEGAA